jgi:hypothetical protein
MAPSRRRPARIARRIYLFDVRCILDTRVRSARPGRFIHITQMVNEASQGAPAAHFPCGNSPLAMAR